MEIGLLIIVAFVALVGLVLYRFHKPSGAKARITGRGGDFQE